MSDEEFLPDGLSDFTPDDLGVPLGAIERLPDGRRLWPSRRDFTLRGTAVEQLNYAMIHEYRRDLARSKRKRPSRAALLERRLRQQHRAELLELALELARLRGQTR
jgi:hypothetical protein